MIFIIIYITFIPHYHHGVCFIEIWHESDGNVVESSQIEDACRLKHYRWVNKHAMSRQRLLFILYALLTTFCWKQLRITLLRVCVMHFIRIYLSGTQQDVIWLVLFAWRRPRGFVRRVQTWFWSRKACLNEERTKGDNSCAPMIHLFNSNWLNLINCSLHDMWLLHDHSSLFL
jgi:hypothetical protein